MHGIKFPCTCTMWLPSNYLCSCASKDQRKKTECGGRKYHAICKGYYGFYIGLSDPIHLIFNTDKKNGWEIREIVLTWSWSHRQARQKDSWNCGHRLEIEYILVICRTFLTPIWMTLSSQDCVHTKIIPPSCHHIKGLFYLFIRQLTQFHSKNIANDAWRPKEWWHMKFAWK